MDILEKKEMQINSFQYSQEDCTTTTFKEDPISRLQNKHIYELQCQCG